MCELCTLVEPTGFDYPFYSRPESEARPVPKCKKHKVELICPACMGERSSRIQTKAKKIANRKNLRLAWKARRKYTRCRRYQSHHFSAVTGICPCGYKRPAAA